MVTRVVKIETHKQETIRARLYTPPSSTPPTRAAILAHPYHNYGGSYNNHVLCYLATILESLGVIVLTFNFRRRKSSWSGHTEITDMKQVADWLLHHPGHEEVNDLIISGYSYGALIASAVTPHAIADREIRLCYLLISLPLLISKYYLWLFPKPKRVYNAHRTLIVWGTEDEFAPLSRIKRKSGRDQLTILLINGCGHWIEDEEYKEEMREYIIRWVEGADGIDLVAMDGRPSIT